MKFKNVDNLVKEVTYWDKNCSLSQIRHNLFCLHKNKLCYLKKGSFYYCFIFDKLECVVKIIRWDDSPKTFFHKSPDKGSFADNLFLHPIYSNKNSTVMIQPLADTRQAIRALSEIIDIIIKEKIKKHIVDSLTEIWGDPTSSNVGYYQGKPVIFDFSHGWLE